MKKDKLQIILVRQLYDRVAAYRGPALYKEVLRPAQPALAKSMLPLAKFRERNTEEADYRVNQDELQQWYALSRLNELALASFQRADPRKKLPVAKVSLEDYLTFFNALGFTVSEQREFAPFYHEIVEVDQAPQDDEAVSIAQSFWPALMFGQMLFSRGGLRIRCGKQIAEKKSAESSTLYFAHWRLNRPTEDLGSGWGPNSQWQTPFRRDYTDDSFFYYNIDGAKMVDSTNLPMRSPHGLSLDQRIERLINRCWVRGVPDNDDGYPYRDETRQTKL